MGARASPGHNYDHHSDYPPITQHHFPVGQCQPLSRSDIMSPNQATPPFQAFATLKPKVHALRKGKVCPSCFWPWPFGHDGHSQITQTQYDVWSDIHKIDSNGWTLAKHWMKYMSSLMSELNGKWSIYCTD